MNEKQKEIVEDVELDNIEKKSKKEEFDSILEKVKKMSDAIEFHLNVKEAVSKKEVDKNYLKYIENCLEDRFFFDAKFNEIRSKVLLEIVFPELSNIENFKIEKLEIKDLGAHFEEQENYIDKICTYDDKFICLFGISEVNSENAIKYEPRKFSRIDIIEAICEKLQEGKMSQMEQYDEYYVVSDKNGIKVFSERKVTSLLKVEETILDKMKNKVASILNKKVFSKKKYLPNIELIYDSNPNRFKDFKSTSKADAKNRMKALLNKEREVTRIINN